MSAIRLLFLVPVLFLLGSCGAPRDTVGSRGMQNITARYNILYNARLLLEESRSAIESAWLDDYTQLLPVFKEPVPASAKAETAILDSVIGKANKVILEKPNSNYVGAAYLLMAQANYLKTNFFSAAEFFDYVDKTYTDKEALRQEALLGKARAALQLSHLAEAQTALDTALKHLSSSKKLTSQVYAVQAQLSVQQGSELQAIGQLKKALAAKPEKQNRIRWTFILAQLQERNGEKEQALKNYLAVIKSNAPFEMAFNASVNRISLNEEGNDEKSVTERLLRLLKDDKNKDFADQIYFRIGSGHRENQQLQEAINYYNKSVRSSTKNQNQKGLAYLQLADIYFGTADYAKAKVYYDSTLATLPPSYPEYKQIALKSANLDLLAGRLQTIAHEEMLQDLARLPADERELRIGELVREQSRQAIANQTSGSGTLTGAIDLPAGQSPATGKFYFNNSAALSQGFSDFKRIWGNRRLEDNWRRSDKTATEVTAQASGNNAGTINSVAVSEEQSAAAAWLKNLPLTPEQLQQSNQRIADAWFDIANFYKDELNDKQEAIKAFESLLSHNPESNYKLAVYYNLYRLYETLNPAKAEEYKNLLLSKYPESPFARVILDPSYSQKADAQESAIREMYDKLYDLYAAKKYREVLTEIRTARQQYGENRLSPQWAYLEALAIGRTQPLPGFEEALQKITERYPNDKIVTPLSREHLEYIRQHREQLAKRATALTDFDPNRPRFVDEPEPEKPLIAAEPTQVSSKTPMIAAQPDTPVLPGETKPAADVAVKPAPSDTENSLFSLPDSAVYYFVINVMLPRANLNSSRFGIGQFNRANYKGADLKHQLKYAGNQNQLIYTGVFHNKAAAKDYERNILPLLGEIMKVPAEKYNTFVVTQEGLDKLNSGMMLEAYLEFYKNSN